MNSPDVREQVLPLLEHFPQFRAWLKRSVYEPPADHAAEPGATDLRALSARGLMIYGILSALEERGQG